MILKYSSIIGLPVADLKDQSHVGKVSEVIIDPCSVSIAAVAVEQPSWLFSKSRFVIKLDVVYLLKNGVIIEDAESLIDREESVNIERLIKSNNFGIGQKVVTSSGILLGHVYDFLVESESLSITKFYIKHLLRERIISIDKIESVDGKLITVKDNQNLAKIKTMPLQETLAA